MCQVSWSTHDCMDINIFVEFVCIFVHFLIIILIFIYRKLWTIWRLRSFATPTPTPATAVSKSLCRGHTEGYSQLAGWTRTLSSAPTPANIADQMDYQESAPSKRGQIPFSSIQSSDATDLKSTPNERSLRYRCVRSMPTRLASLPTLPSHNTSCCCR